MTSPSDGWKTLTQELEELERVDPAVAEASRRFDAAVDSILYRHRSGVPVTRFHKSTDKLPCEAVREAPLPLPPDSQAGRRLLGLRDVEGPVK